jgi:branched-chain amino acid transport system substrate-binding protein
MHARVDAPAVSAVMATMAGRPGRFRLSALLVLLTALVLAACVPGQPFPSTSSSHVARLGAALSLTGVAGVSGQTQRNAILLARDEINAAHLLGTTELEVTIEDDRSDREQAAAVFQKFIETGHVLGILGPTLSDAAQAVDPLAQQAGVPVLAVSNAAGGLTQIGDFIFRDCLSDGQLTPRVVKAVRQRLRIQDAALLYVENDANRTGSRGFKLALQNMHVAIAAEQSFAPDATDFSVQLDQIAAAQPDALFINAPTHAAATILTQARQHGLAEVPIVGGNSFNSAAVLRAAGAAAEGLIVGSGWSLINPTPRNQQFIDAYRARYNMDPDQVAAQAYSGVYIYAAALKDVPSTSDPRVVRDALERVHDLDTPLGRFSFNEAHDANYPPIVHVVHNGQFELF